MLPMPKIIIIGILAYFIYRFVFNFLIPIVRTTRQVRRQFKNMHDAVNGQGGTFQQGGPFQPGGPFQQGGPFQPGGFQQGNFQQGAYHQETAQPQDRTQKPSNDKMGEYIDFEEI